jgi:hypothetical protein
MIKVDKNYTDWKNEVDTKSLDHFSHMHGDTYVLIAIDGPLYFECKLDQDDKSDYESNYLPSANGKLGNYYSREPFASKTLRHGEKLFRRKHGQKATIPANSSLDVIFTCPYTKAKINKLEIIDANARDRVDLIVRAPLDQPTASAYGLTADQFLNQFGDDVIISDFLYSDKSDYDADVYAGFQIVIVYKNDTISAREVGFNLIYHEVT